MIPRIQNFSVRSLVILFLVLSGCGLAVIDRDFRPIFGDIIKFGLGGYTGQLVPRQ